MIGDNKIGECIDRKFEISAMCIEHGHSYDHNHAILFLAKDLATPATLRFYHNECRRLGAEEAQLRAIDLLIERVERYQKMNPSILKVADVDAVLGRHIFFTPNKAVDVES